jgi:hypothetical protein
MHAMHLQNSYIYTQKDKTFEISLKFLYVSLVRSLFDPYLLRFSLHNTQDTRIHRRRID